MSRKKKEWDAEQQAAVARSAREVLAALLDVVAERRAGLGLFAQGIGLVDLRFSVGRARIRLRLVSEASGGPQAPVIVPRPRPRRK